MIARRELIAEVSLAFFFMTPIVYSADVAEKGIVTVTYRDVAGHSQTTELDEYLLDNLPAVLEAIADRATGATHLDPEDGPGRPAASA